ncbi:oxidoreductase-like protein [Cadophora sp. DSE1049]|nr:oxidoreductase-like protein [Cadophora sp. DSE1049]
MAIGIAVLGAGIFAKEQHVPAILACPSFALKAVYSRSQKSVDGLVASQDLKVDTYYDSPETPSQSLDALLKRDDIQAVIIGVPILAQPALIRKAISAGKHVMSEKPMAQDLSTAQELLDWYKQPEVSKLGLWAVGENFRFWNSVNRGAELVREIGGNLLTFRVNYYTLIPDDDKYLKTEWRKTPGYQGGFLLDGGVHCAALLRYLVGATGQKITKLSAFTYLIKPQFKPIDTVHVVLQTSNGSSGNFDISFATAFKTGFEAEIVTDKGSVLVHVTDIETTTQNAEGEKINSKEEVSMTVGVTEEVAVFAKAIEEGHLDPRLLPQEAFQDLEIIENIIKSGEGGAEPRKIGLLQ